jgi:hypothetical protein
LRINWPNFSDTLVVEPGSWHARVYHYWRDRAEFKTSGYRENLCHYIRVLVIWAPLAWLLTARIARFLPVWLAIMLAELVGAFFIWPPLMAILVLEIVAFLYLPVFQPTDRQKRYFRRIRQSLEPIERLVAPPVQAIGRGLKPPVNWFLKSSVLVVIRPWTVVLTAIVVYLSIFQTWFIVDMLLLLAGFAGLCLLIGLAMATKDAIRGLMPYRYGPRRHHVRETIKVAGHAVSAKKRGVCPFIEIHPR